MIPRSETLLRRVLRWTPSERAERQKLPRLDFREATMNCRSNSRLACSSVTPRRTSSSTIRCRRPLRFWSAKCLTLKWRREDRSRQLNTAPGPRRPGESNSGLLRIEPVAQADEIARLEDLRHREVLVDRQHRQL